MGTTPIIYPPPIWTDQDLILFHGAIDAYAAAIVRGRVLTSLGRKGTDFGPGFYTTTLLAQVHTGAAQLSATVPGANPAVVPYPALTSPDVWLFRCFGINSTSFQFNIISTLWQRYRSAFSLSSRASRIQA
jgi:hypothetical protein